MRITVVPDFELENEADLIWFQRAIIAIWDAVWFDEVWRINTGVKG